MKLSEGLSRLAPALGVGLLFLAGAGLQTLAMNRSDLAVTYLVVLGLEAVLAFTFGVVIFGEACSPARIAGVALVAAGIASLRFSG
jgi:multidrug transporter EmrE-like cation transporter